MQRIIAYGRPEAVMSAALFAICFVSKKRGGKKTPNEKRTIGPRVLGASVVVLSIETECEQIEVRIEHHAWRGGDNGLQDG